MSDFYNKYPYTDFHELNLDWVIERVKKLTEDWLATQQEWNDTEEQWQQLYDYVHDYFANLDVQNEINNKINQMILDGTFMTIVTPTINQTVVNATTTWLAAHITQPTTPAVDTSLSIAGAAADAKVVGDIFNDKVVMQRGDLDDYDTDLDNFTTCGIYYHGSSQAPVTNQPSDVSSSGAFNLIVIRGGSNTASLFQLLNVYNSDAVFFRAYAVGAWGSWNHMADQNTISNVLDVIAETEGRLNYTEVLYQNDVTLAPTLQYGYYNGSGNWQLSNQYVANKVMMSLPSGLNIKGITTIANAAPFISELKYVGGVLTRIRVASAVGPNLYAVMTDTKADCLYSMGLRKNNGVDFPSVPATGYTFTAYSEAITNNSDAIVQLQNDISFINENLTTGQADYNYSLVLGSYDATATWNTNAHHASVDHLLQFPSGLTLIFDTTIAGVSPTIKEYSYSGEVYTRTRNIGGNPAIMTGTDENKFYSFDLYNPDNEYVTAPTSGYRIYSIYDYLYGINQDIYDLKNRSNKGSYSYIASSKTLTITNPKTKYILKRITNAGDNIDSWRLYEGDVMVNGNWSQMWQNSDAEGPIKLVGESNYISGYHGNEILSAVSIYIDGTLLDLSTDASGDFDTIILYQTSTVYLTDGVTQAFTRYKKLTFNGNNYSCQQKWVALASCTIEYGALALMQCYKTDMIGWDTDRLLPLQSINTEPALDPETIRGTFYMNGGNTLTLIADVGYNNNYYYPFIKDYTLQNRLKFYFMMYDGLAMSVSDSISSKFTFAVNDFIG